MNEYFYLSDKNELIKITGKQRPRKTNKTYVCRELINGEFVLGCYPEITWGKLVTMDYIGSRRLVEDWEHTRAMCS